MAAPSGRDRLRRRPQSSHRKRKLLEERTSLSWHSKPRQLSGRPGSNKRSEPTGGYGAGMSRRQISEGIARIGSLTAPG